MLTFIKQITKIHKCGFICCFVFIVILPGMIGREVDWLRDTSICKKVKDVRIAVEGGIDRMGRDQGMRSQVPTNRILMLYRSMPQNWDLGTAKIPEN